jgi:thymidylate synthase (FAD)
MTKETINLEAELAETLAMSATTKRVTVPALEPLLYQPHKVLDHGFIRLIDYMGDDNAVVQAARVSYGKGTKKVSEDRGLIHYLMRHRHTTPFEMCDIKFHVKLPIFVARQWIRHRTASVNEYSARYSVLGKEFYIPSPDHLSPQSASNRQGRDAESLTGEEAARVLALLKGDSEMLYDHYQEMLNMDENGQVINPEREGLARELARMNLSINYYTEWYWKTNLHNLLHFCSLRADPHAQYEIRVYADIMLDLVKAWVPLTYEAFMEYRMHGVSLSANAMKLIRAKLQGEQIAQETSGMTKREWAEVMALLPELAS